MMQVCKSKPLEVNAVLFSFIECSYFKMQKICFHLGLQRFSVCEVKSSRCTQPASTSLVSWPVTATISRHLPIKATHFLPSSPRDSLSDRATTAPRLLIGHFPANIPEWLTSSLGSPRCDFSYSSCGQFWDRPHLCNFDLYFFYFCCCFFPTEPKTLICFRSHFQA